MRFAVAALACTLVACAARSDESSDERTGSAAQPIINGAVSTPDQNFVVQLGISTNGQYFGACSAIMVAKNLVLTARHCVGTFKDETSWTMVDFAPEGLEVYYGADAPTRSDATAKQAGDAKGAKLFLPPTDQMIPDIALVLLDRPIATAQIAKIRLDGGAKKSELLDIVGYGINESSLDPTVRMQRKAIPVLGVGPLTTTQHDLFDGEFFFGEAACSGDSGGPALSATTHAVVGVASRVGNGVEPTEQNPASFCVGSATEDVYTSLAPVKDVVLKAFEAAGAKPLLEGDPEPVPEKPAQPAPQTTSTDDEEEPAKPPATKRTTKPTIAATNGGCTISSEANTTSSAWPLVVVMLGALGFARRTKRARCTRQSHA